MSSVDDLKELISSAYQEHIRDHTATADFEVCQNEKCHFAYTAELAIAEAAQQSAQADGARCACRQWHSVYIGLLCRQCGARIAPRQ